MIEVKLTNCKLYLTEQEIESLMARDPPLWQIALKRGKSIQRHETQRKREAAKYEKSHG